MKALLLNGSPNLRGCTYTALSQVAEGLESCGVGAEIHQLAVRGAVRGCIACGRCAKAGRCIFDEDGVNEVLDKMRGMDGLVIGSPVYYASPNGALIAQLDRMFYAGARTMAYKPGAAVVSARRAGTTASLEVLQKYFTISNMPLTPSQYWPMVHGNTAEQALQDEEGMQIMRTLGRNMAWMIKCFAAGDAPPLAEAERKRTNFIR